MQTTILPIIVVLAAFGVIGVLVVSAACSQRGRTDERQRSSGDGGAMGADGGTGARDGDRDDAEGGGSSDGDGGGSSGGDGGGGGSD